MEILNTEGCAATRAEAQGAAFGHLVPEAMTTIRGLVPMPGWLGRGLQETLVSAGMGLLGRLYLARHRRLLGDSGLLDPLRSLAAGMGLPPHRLYAFNALELESAHLGWTMGCTSLAFTDDQTTDGAPRLAYNHDFPPAWGPFLFIRRSRPTDGELASLSITYPTVLGAIAGVNEAGLAVTINQAYATDLRRGRAGLFATLVLQRCLDTCTSVDDAVALALATAVPAGAMLTMVDERGARAVCELSGTRRVRRPPISSDEVSATFNRYEVRELAEVEIPVGAVTRGPWAGIDVHACNLSRAARLDELVADHGDGGWSDAEIEAVLADHDRGDGDTLTICRHDDPLGETIVSALIDPLARTIRVRHGRGCDTPAETVGLDVAVRQPVSRCSPGPSWPRSSLRAHSR